MPDRPQTAERLESIGAAAVIRMTDTERLVHVAEALAKGGVEAIEITMTVPGAIEMIRAARRKLGADLLLGVGSVTTPRQAREAVEAGARFVVSPVFKEDVVAATLDAEAVAMPAGFTPTEIQRAHEAGADFVKVFPASVHGKKFIKAVRAPLPHLKLVPTGGVGLCDAGDWIGAGASLVGVGSALLDEDAIAAGDYTTLTDNARRLRNSIDAARE
ncbi:MAG: 2-dehydro-3-deoxyphosphogluconate aldolase [Bacteroidetes bacterium QS_8_68_28]|jgi:2-dehydro-3-deoxyphosphogluconate aldolase/(4S)-4-hydroxy-2-oxoglutarate aldolase|nr:MAG: 2-dehydro-3-deoxyphosphogluconate aldolase [Bacteroidetes bacterium QS_8_68_28]